VDNPWIQYLWEEEGTGIKARKLEGLGRIIKCFYRLNPQAFQGCCGI
jgi:hypothetical protein